MVTEPEPGALAAAPQVKYNEQVKVESAYTYDLRRVSVFGRVIQKGDVAGGAALSPDKR